VPNLITVVLVFLILPGAFIALSVGFYLGSIRNKAKFAEDLRAQKDTSEQRLLEVQEAQRQALRETRDETAQFRATIEHEQAERRTELQRQERRLQQKEENYDRKIDALELRDRKLNAKERHLDQMREELEKLKHQQLNELERVAQLTEEQAKALLLARIESQARNDAAQRVRMIEEQAREEGEARAREIITLAIQRCASDQVAESVVSVVPLPNDEMKGRIIGREGRNIRALEAATGIDLIIDDTPEAVILSGFDPVRREIARVALTKLILDGRIHPARIEDVVAKARQEVDTIIREAGENAA
jgi:ribonuclease Y